MNIFRKITLVIFSVMVLLPIVFMFSNSFMSPKEAESRYTEAVTPYNIWSASGDKHFYEITLLPDYITAQGYRDTLNNHTYMRMFWNSAIIMLPILIIQLVVSPMAAYSLEMMNWKYKELLYLIYIVLMLMPIQFLMVPHYIAAEFMGFNNTW